MWIGVNIIRREPWGVAAVISPWNYPLQMPIWGLIPTLVAGNTVVFKPSEETPLVAQVLAKMISELDLPSGTFNIVYGNGKVGEKLIDQDINLVHFTGSSKVGQKIFAKAGDKFIKAIMELGGSSPAIIFDDVLVDDDLINNIYIGRYENCAQSCSATKRLFVHESIFDKTVQRIVAMLQVLKIGDPLLEDTDMGSLVAKRQLDLLEDQVKDAVKKGAKVECGGKRPAGLNGAYYLPTVLTGVTRDMRVMTEEVFGPVLPVVSFISEEEAIVAANDTEYGLSAEVYTKDKERAYRVASKIQAGRIRINTASWGHSHCPFGGYKKSGMGREHGRWGFEELTQIKHVMEKKM